MNFLVIEGNIGAGKTTLAQMISSDYNAQLVTESFAGNPFLPKFYANPSTYAFTLEMSFLAERYSQLMNELQNRDLFKDFAVADYYFMKSLIFASVTLSDDEFTLYRKFFNLIYARLPRPDLYVFLHKDTDVLQKMIKKRGRDYESNIADEYLDNITKAYFNYFKQQSEFPVVIIDTTNIDFVKNDKDYLKICDTIFQNSYSSGITRVIL
ncbi:MAG TPA: deoxynucleoside kinase [Prolixibacteraceae bacterium]|nr:deoxynucleoside kinase [Prolixibacteraceae bacterium]HQN93740.1 deoxynucleoside kinase [Prolixibacteraceae bacterium]